jgi:hypothetical protein
VQTRCGSQKMSPLMILTPRGALFKLETSLSCVEPKALKISKSFRAFYFP